MPRWDDQLFSATAQPPSKGHFDTNILSFVERLSSFRGYFEYNDTFVLSFVERFVLFQSVLYQRGSPLYLGRQGITHFTYIHTSSFWSCTQSKYPLLLVLQTPLVGGVPLNLLEGVTIKSTSLEVTFSCQEQYICPWGDHKMDNWPVRWRGRHLAHRSESWPVCWRGSLPVYRLDCWTDCGWGSWLVYEWNDNEVDGTGRSLSWPWRGIRNDNHSFVIRWKCMATGFVGVVSDVCLGEEFSLFCDHNWWKSSPYGIKSKMAWFTPS